MSSKQQTGMTLIEVLIASVILFISISAISYVTQAMLLNERRLVTTAQQSYMLEYIQDEVRYQYEYNLQVEGEYKYDGESYYWRVEVVSEKPALTSVGGSESGETSNGTMILYKCAVFSQLLPAPKKITEFKNVFWREAK
nr:MULTISPECIES: prepilin-type N-terminal cleavage/methylation domain-containing protein [Pseudoalteromonas]